MTLGAWMLAGGLLMPIGLEQAESTSRPAPPVVLLVSIDGLRADYLTEADSYGLKIPTLRRLMRDGISARRMQSIFPSVTYPAHVSLITGEPPARHGIYDNEEFEPQIDERAPWYWSARAIRVPTLIDAFRKAGRHVACIGWPVTVDAAADWNVPELWEATDFPGTFVARSRSASTPGLVEAAEKAMNFMMHIDRIDEDRTRIARYVVMTHRPDLMLLHYNELDKKQHQLGPAVPEVWASLERLDGCLGQVLSAYEAAGLKDRLTVCVVSDHGFERVDRMFKPNAVLRDAGLLTVDNDTKKVMTWRAKVWASGGSGALILADPSDAEAARLARAALGKYAGAPDAAIAEFIGAPDVRKLGSNVKAAFMFDAGKGWMVSRSARGEPVEPAPIHGMHGQRPERAELGAAFVICGRGVQGGPVLPLVRMIDVAPTLASLAGVPMPGTSGQPISGVSRSR